MTRRVQSINPNDPQALRKVIEALEVSEGVRGNKDDRKPTIKEVRAMLGSGNSTDTSIAFGGSSGGVSGGAVPSKPSGLSAKEFEDFIVLMWDWPLYQGHSGSEIYRSTTDSLASSERIGSTDSNYFVDWMAVAGQTYYYFICHKNAVSLGGRTSPFSESVYGKRVDPVVVINPVAKAGIINTTGATPIDLGSIDDGKTILINISGIFTSEIEYDEIGAALLSEDGNAVAIILKKNGVAIQTLTPTKTQTSLIGPNGQAKYLHTVSNSIVELSTAGALTYTMEVTRLFPSNNDTFQISYSIQTL
tara:strand:+ start:22494 stop:23405 length:912 start_codon:yes stop_codon:yes gene_type:complete